MSNINTRRNDATTALNFGKLLAVFGWVLIALGGLISLTLIGAVIGIPMILIGCLLTFVFGKMLSDRGNAILKDLAEEQSRAAQGPAGN